MTEPTKREKRPNICHAKRYTNMADKDMPTIKTMEAIR